MTTGVRADYDPFAWFYDEYWCRGVTGDFLHALERLLLPRLAARARLLDLCCGTGRIAANLTARGFSVTGLDISAEMLSYARRNAPAAEFVAADARAFSLPPTFHAAISTFDSINHILSLGELAAAFRNVRRSLVGGGVFFFDVNLEMGFREHWREHYSAIEAERVCLVKGYYDAAARLGRYDFTLFRQLNGCWHRSDFSISERCYTKAELRDSLGRAGFSRIKFFDAPTAAGLREHRGRVFILAEKSDRTNDDDD
ncbi:MAG TPA: methyltransferase domain-containing protein [Pyrinomonadaceae bacterium]